MCIRYCYDEKVYADFDKWKDAYVDYLKGPYREGKGENIYQDPDCKRNYRLDYYRSLAEFLNQRESDLSDEINDEEFVYKADHYIDEDKGVLILVKSKDGEFYLKSDQFGFSAPNGYVFKGYKKHIYDVYLELLEDKKKKFDENVLDNVATWIWKSRTIGGSFLWPLEDREIKRGNPAYNMARGKYYTQDRCDLTLAEIRGCYEKDMRTIGEERNYLYNKMRKKENKNLKRWLRHFGDFETGGFETYVKYFCMGNFVYEEKNNKRLCPINLYEKTNMLNCNYQHEDIYDRTENEEKYYKNLFRMLDKLCEKIIARSRTMEKIILNK